MRAVIGLFCVGLLGACGDAGSSPGTQGDTTRDTSADIATDVDVGDWNGENPYEDEDFDEVPDDVDNCVGIYNPNQSDVDRDGVGDLCDALNDDRDGDGIPDTNDPFPDDGARPGQVNANTVYAHTSGTLDGRMTDIAVDRYGVMWGIGFSDVFIINPNNAECWRMAALPQEFNGLTLIPRGVLGTETDILVGVSIAGGWWRLDLVQDASGPRVATALLGQYGSTWTSSGDAFSIEGVGTFASVKRGSFGSDELVELNPGTGLVTRVVGPLGTYGKVWGLAGWANRVYGFDEGGDIFEIELSTGQLISKKSTNHAWWGAGVKTVLDAEE